jgi:peptidylprolyl isomerase
VRNIFVRRLLLVLTAVLLLIVTGCGSDGSDGSDSSDGADTSDGASTEAFPGVTVSGATDEMPEVTVDDPPFTVKKTETEVLEEGDGDQVREGDQAQLQYLGINGRTGEEFDSSWARGGEPVTFALEEGGLIQGFLDGLIGQTYGSRIAIAIPPDQGYGPAGGQPEAGIEADDTLVFVVDLLEAAPAPLSMAEGEEQPAPADLPKLQTDAEGVPTGFKATSKTPASVDELVVAPVIVGDGPELAVGQTATVHYVGQLYPDGEVFDESWGSGQPAQFPLAEGGLIQGFLDGLTGQTVGSRVIIAIPSEQGYGAAGSPPAIPENADLIFVVDILAAS